MANFQAIATVTAALRARLLETVPADVPGAGVSALTPAAPSAGGIPSVGVNIFLFAIHIDPAQRNRDLPVRRAGGDVIGTPVIPVNLDYLFSFYGDANGDAHQVAGSVMRSLYARPILTAAMITAVEGGTTGLNSNLAAQADRVRFTPLPVPIEEMSKIWSVFFQTSYALSVAFRAGPVLIEADMPTLPGPPVASPVVVVSPMLQPVIDSVVASGGAATTPILAGAGIDILGTELNGGVTTVLVGGNAVTPSYLSDSRLTLTLPAGLAAGPQALQIRQDIALPSGGTRPGALSQSAAFQLAPEVAKTGTTYAITLNNEAGTGTAPRSATISVGVVPAVQAGQVTQLALLDLNLNTVGVFAELPRSGAASTVAYAIASIPAGTYVLQLRVDGAATPVVTDTTTGSPTFGKPVPQVVFA